MYMIYFMCIRSIEQKHGQALSLDSIMYDCLFFSFKNTVPSFHYLEGEEAGVLCGVPFKGVPCGVPVGVPLHCLIRPIDKPRFCRV